jgi:hypothetical protein
VAILRSQRETIAPHRRPDYAPAQRAAILQLRRLRDWNVVQTAEHFVLHPNTVRSWLTAAEGGTKTSLFAGTPPTSGLRAIRCSYHNFLMRLQLAAISRVTSRATHIHITHFYHVVQQKGYKTGYSFREWAPLRYASNLLD